MADDHAKQLEKVQAARAKFEGQQDAVHDARRDYYTAVAQLHEAGMPLRDIADALGLSHQRVHQMIAEAAAPTPKRAAARAAKLGGTAVLLLVLGLGLYSLAGTNQDPTPSPQAQSATADPEPSKSQPDVDDVTKKKRTHRGWVGDVDYDIVCHPSIKCLIAYGADLEPVKYRVRPGDPDSYRVKYIVRGAAEIVKRNKS